MGESQGYHLSLSIDADKRRAADRAIDLITGFYPGVSARIDGADVRLQSHSRETEQLALIWKVTLANECFHERSREHRTALLQGLLT